MIAPAVPWHWRKRSPLPVAITCSVTPGVRVAEAATVGSIAVAIGPSGVQVTVAGAGAGGRVLFAGAVALGPGPGVLAAVTRPGSAAGARSRTPAKNATNASKANPSAATINTNFRRGDIA